MASSAFPMPQTPPLPTYGMMDPRGGIAGQMGAAGGTQLYPPRMAPEIINGINQFLTNYRSQTDAEKQRHLAEFQHGVSMLQQGIPVDLKKLAKSAQKAKLPLDFENAPAQPAQPPIPAGPPGSMPGIPPQMGAASQLPGAAGTTGMPAQGPPPQGGFGRFAQAAGWTQPPVQENSPGMQWLQKVKGMGNLALSGAQDEAQFQQLKIKSALGAIMNDPRSLETAQRLGIFKELEGDPTFRLGDMLHVPREQTAGALLQMQMNPPALLKAKAEMAEKLYPYAKNPDGTLNPALARDYVEGMLRGLPPSQLPKLSISEEQSTKILDKTIEIMKEQNVPWNIAALKAHGAVMGDNALSGAADQALSAKDKSGKPLFPTWAALKNERENNQLALEKNRFGYHMLESTRDYDLNMKKSILENLSGTEKDYAAMLANPQADQASKNAAVTGLVSALRAKGAIDFHDPYSGKAIKIPTSDITTENVWRLFHPFEGVTQLALPPSQALGGGAAQPGALANFSNYLMKTLGGANDQYPPALRESFQRSIQQKIAEDAARDRFGAAANPEN